MRRGVRSGGAIDSASGGGIGSVIPSPGGGGMGVRRRDPAQRGTRTKKGEGSR
jgi:hypothetical protein